MSNRRDSTKCPTAHRISVTNLLKEETLTFSLALLKGEINLPNNDASYCNNYLTLYNLSKKTATNWPILKSKFKCLVDLQRGENRIILKYCTTCKRLVLNYKPRDTEHVVLPLYIVCRDHTGEFQAPKGCDNSIDSACSRVVLGSKLIQCLIAEKLFENGFGRKTFQIEADVIDEIPYCIQFNSNLPLEEARKMDQEALWVYFGREIMKSNFSSTKRKFLAFLSATWWEGGGVKAHAALGGGGLALFGTGCLHTWPTRVEDVFTCFLDPTPVDTSRVMDDSCFRGTYGGCFSTTLGSVCHELGHTFDLGHSRDGIMGRGFDNIDMVFIPHSHASRDTIQFATVQLISRLKVECFVTALGRFGSPLRHFNQNQVEIKPNSGRNQVEFKPNSSENQAEDKASSSQNQIEFKQKSKDGSPGSASRNRGDLSHTEKTCLMRNSCINCKGSPHNEKTCNSSENCNIENDPRTPNNDSDTEFINEISNVNTICMENELDPESLVTLNSSDSVICSSGDKNCNFDSENGNSIGENDSNCTSNVGVDNSNNNIIPNCYRSNDNSPSRQSTNINLFGGRCNNSNNSFETEGLNDSSTISAASNGNNDSNTSKIATSNIRSNNSSPSFNVINSSLNKCVDSSPANHSNNNVIPSNNLKTSSTHGSRCISSNNSSITPSTHSSNPSSLNNNCPNSSSSNTNCPNTTPKSDSSRKRTSSPNRHITSSPNNSSTKSSNVNSSPNNPSTNSPNRRMASSPNSPSTNSSNRRTISSPSVTSPSSSSNPSTNSPNRRTTSSTNDPSTNSPNRRVTTSSPSTNRSKRTNNNVLVVQQQIKNKDCDSLVDDRTYWTPSCAILLAYHKWFNNCGTQSNRDELKYNAVRGLVTSTAGLRVVELRGDESLVLHSWQFSGQRPKHQLVVPKQMSARAQLIVCEDTNGNIIKQELGAAGGISSSG